MYNNIAIVGGSGAIGYALLEQLANTYPAATIHAFSRSPIIDIPPHVTWHTLADYSEDSLHEAASYVNDVDLVLVATGMLHSDTLSPEKSLRDLSANAFEQLFMANTIVPALAAKHFLPKLVRNKRALFAALSARVGSISDNRLGGWYSYRAAKAALNMVIKNAAIETARRHKQAIVVGLHPGTVDSPLSEPFQARVAEGQLFTAQVSAQYLLNVLGTLTPASSGKCFAWDGKEIPA